MQHTATYCNTPQHTATHYSHVIGVASSSAGIQLTFNHLQHTVTYCNQTLQQQTATDYHKLQLSDIKRVLPDLRLVCTWLLYSSQHTASPHCIALQHHTATPCNTLQHTATYCDTLRHTATHCTALYYNTATRHCKTLPNTATRCNTLQHTATYCNTLQHAQMEHMAFTNDTPFCGEDHSFAAPHCTTTQHTATHCSALQHTASHWCTHRWSIWHVLTLQHTATHCNTLQHNATYCNILNHTGAHTGEIKLTCTNSCLISLPRNQHTSFVRKKYLPWDGLFKCLTGSVKKRWCHIQNVT